MSLTINALKIGGLALDVLDAGISGRVAGITSKGIFLNVMDKILFLTDAPYSSPFNLQISRVEELSNLLQNNEEFSIKGHAILFDSAKVKIEFRTTKSWQPDNPLPITNPHAEQEARIVKLVSLLRDLDAKKGWIFLYKRSGDAQVDLESSRIRQLTASFVQSYLASDLTGCLNAAKFIIGLGGGLTPSGDDWLTGFLLLQTRYDQSRGVGRKFVNDLGNFLTELAFEKTTKISANRIEAACIGWAEEIFLEVIDHVFSASKDLEGREVEILSGFGHSSGVDTCMGIYSGWMTL